MKCINGFVFLSLFSAAVFANSGYPAKVYLVPARTAHFYVSHFENVLGTSMELKMAMFSPQASRRCECIVLNEIARLSKILSGYDAQSEFSRWLQTKNMPVHVSHELFEVLSLFDNWRIRTGGALDASAEIVSCLWKQAAKQQQLPTEAQMAAVVKEVRKPHWRLDPVTGTAIHLDQEPLMLNSFAKSYIIKHAADAALRVAGADAVIVNIGGDIVVAGNVKEKVLVSDPRADAENDTPLDIVTIGNSAIATSGNYRRGEEIGGHWYSHIVDPRTGRPADGVLSATVVAPMATDAGALATAFNVLTPVESIRLARQYPGIEYLIVTCNGQRIQSSGWKALQAPDANMTGSVETASFQSNGAPRTIGKDFELLVNLEIAMQKEGSVKRPYVAIWVEDQEHAPVRTIIVWHGSNRYLPELKSWYLKYRGLYTSDPNFDASSTSATRSAGKYTVKWNGKDDKGNEEKPGKYIVKIEVSREHGTYQLMRQEIDCDDSPKTIKLSGNTEIAAASLDYRKKNDGN